MSKYRNVRFFLKHKRSSRDFCNGNHVARSKPIYKMFNLMNWELNKVYLCQK